MNLSKFRVAIGLGYKRGYDVCPRVTLRTEDQLADKVVILAKRYKVPVIENPSLAVALLELQLDTRIPEELFNAVALVFAEIEGLL